MTVKEQEIEIPDKGLVIVSGVNNASAGKMSSVGSGKTALGEALGRSILGIDGRFAQLAHYSRHDKGNTYVRVEGLLNGQEFSVEHGYKCPELSRTGAGLRFRVGAQEPIERDRVQATRTELDTLIGISAELSKWTVHLDGGMLQFDDLSQRNAVGLLMRAMNQPPWDELYERAHKTCSQFRQELQQAQITFNSHKAELDRASADVIRAEQALDDERERLKTLEARREGDIAAAKQRVQQLESYIVDLEQKHNLLEKKASKALEESTEQSRQLTNELTKANAQIEELSQLVNGIVERRGQVSSSAGALERQIDLLDRKQRAPVPQKPAKSHLATVVDQVKFADDELSKVNELIDHVESARNRLGWIISEYWKKPEPEPERPDFSNEIAELDAQLVKTRQKLDEIKSEYTLANNRLVGAKEIRAEIMARKRQIEAKSKPATDELDAVIRDIKDHSRKLEQAKQRLSEAEHPVESKVAALEAVLVERKSRVERLNGQVMASSDDVAKSEVVLRAGQYWEEAYGPTGIPNMILRDSVASLNDVSRRISTLMTGGTIQISYSTSKEMKSGDSKSQLNISVHNKFGASRIQGNSKGESGLTNLIIAETLAEVGRVSGRIGYRWYDEITNGQDSQVRSSIFAYLRELANRAGIVIFLVDHSPEASNYADHALIAEKTEEDGGTTRFSWLR